MNRLLLLNRGGVDCRRPRCNTWLACCCEEVSVQSIIGETRVHMPTTGTIRPGIRVLAKKARENQDAERIYRDSLAEGLTFDQVAKRIEQETKLRNALIPKNTPFFIARPADFPAGVAGRIMDRYGEVREEHSKQRRLYEFPVVLVLDEWLANMPHELQAWQGSGKLYWSEYDEHDRRRCMTYGQVSKEHLRKFGGRGHVEREAPAITIGRNDYRMPPDGECDPDACGLYQSGLCKLKGQLVFHIPRVQTGGLVRLLTNSFYSMSQWRNEMAKVMAIRGTIAETHNGEPIFWVSKKLESVARVVDGRSVKTEQWITHLETRVDLYELQSNQRTVKEAAEELEGIHDDEFDGADDGETFDPKTDEEA